MSSGLASTTYWLSAGIHTLGADQYAQITPGNDSTYLGAPGAMVSGQGKNHDAFMGRATHVTIKNLTIESFGRGSSPTTPSSDDNNDGLGVEKCPGCAHGL